MRLKIIVVLFIAVTLFQVQAEDRVVRPKMTLIDEFGVPNDKESCTSILIKLPHVFNKKTLSKTFINLFGSTFPLAVQEFNKKEGLVVYSLCSNLFTIKKAGIAVGYESNFKDQVLVFYKYQLEEYINKNNQN